MLAAAKAHMLSRDQPDALTAHFEYPNKSAAGPAIITIDEVKIGRQVSVLQLTLWQAQLLSQAPWISPSSRRKTVAYATHTNLKALTGISMLTTHELKAPATLASVPNFDQLKRNNGDDHWARLELPSAFATIPSLKNWACYQPRNGPSSSGVCDMWVCLASGEKFTQASLPYVVDSFPHNVIDYVVPQSENFLGEASGKEVKHELWFPTLSMDLEVKMALAEEGVEWLATK